MVDRKIKAYAQKKKQLDAMEAEHSGTSGATPVPGEEDDRSRGLEKTMEALALKVRSIHEIVSAEGACDDVEACASSLEEHVKRLVVTKSELEQSVAQLNEGEREVRTLLKTLDGLLGLLPSEAIDKFSKTDEFKLYERVLDRLRI
jgi:exonuclease VII small subunit